MRYGYIAEFSRGPELIRETSIRKFAFLLTIVQVFKQYKIRLLICDVFIITCQKSWTLINSILDLRFVKGGDGNDTKFILFLKLNNLLLP
eukprot:g25031.t1